MEKKNFFQRCELLPVNVIATALGFATLSNMWAAAFGFPWVRVLTHIAAAVVWFMAVIRMTRYFQSFKTEYTLFVPCALYATFSMLTMVLGAFILDIHITGIVTAASVPLLGVIGRALWLTGV
ncbi:MAG: hypothetical protein LBG93_05690, partial [Treponema sp.]|nr:hypothetical protein [Treponema sp.]